MSNKEDIAVPTAAVTPSGMNHLVLNVYDMEETHRFWTEIIGLKLVGKLNPGIGYKGQQKPKMQFYSGHDEGRRRHHDIAFVGSEAASQAHRRLEHVRFADVDQPYRHRIAGPRILAQTIGLYAEPRSEVQPQDRSRHVSERLRQ